MSTRNPSPPKELTDDLAHADTIGDTTYSKRWLYSLLMRTVQSVQSSPDGHTARDDGITVDELDPELEEQLCCLWDLTVNPDVLPCLEEFRLTSILSELITCQHYPRLMVSSRGREHIFLCDHLGNLRGYFSQLGF